MTHALVDAAKAHGVKAETLRGACKSGELPARFYGTAGPWLIRCSDIERWLTESSTPNSGYVEARAAEKPKRGRPRKETFPL